MHTMCNQKTCCFWKALAITSVIPVNMRRKVVLAMELAALLLSIAAILLSMYQWWRDNSRQKKESTINAFYNLQSDALNELNMMIAAYDGDMSFIIRGSEDWKKVTGYLSKIEHFSVGINAKVYSLEILNRMAGGYFLHMFEILQPVIQKKRAYNNSNGKHYDEFESAVNHLRKLRKKRDQY